MCHEINLILTISALVNRLTAVELKKKHKVSQFVHPILYIGGVEAMTLLNGVDMFVYWSFRACRLQQSFCAHKWGHITEWQLIILVLGTSLWTVLLIMDKTHVTSVQKAAGLALVS